jgi:N-acetylmuramoyl-L-alanine amidase
MPAVLVEPAYLTNSEEEELINREGFKKEVAKDIFKGIVEYLKNATS